jgi:hypothetical protein
MHEIDRDINLITNELDFIKESYEIPLDKIFIKHKVEVFPLYKISLLCNKSRIDLSEFGTVGQIIDFVRYDLTMMYKEIE